MGSTFFLGYLISTVLHASYQIKLWLWHGSKRRKSSVLYAFASPKKIVEGPRYHSVPGVKCQVRAQPHTSLSLSTGRYCRRVLVLRA
ncbi:hypothetical protein F5141DRAFT_1131752 [Pisolithus sp. B1]|nr:hypothetical protein F5141DRAFT_1131752 [Pisolithus sp. B1]